MTKQSLDDLEWLVKELSDGKNATKAEIKDLAEFLRSMVNREKRNQEIENGANSHLRYVMTNIRNEEIETVKEYIGDYSRNNFIEDIKMPWHNASRPVDTWEYIAIKFKPDTPEKHKLATFVRMNADDYMGIQNGYHVVWFD